jgi:flagellar hook-associated protein FlgK
MWLIEEAKQKFSKDFPGKKPDTYSELLAYIPFTGFPMCPYGGEYQNCLSLDQKTACTLNGDPQYEPETPGTDLKKNGFMDLAKKRDSVTFYEFFHDRISWVGTEKDPMKSENKQKKQLFGTE